ncbi:hypothetical protein L6164_013603 [Bauhinia variegata]|uniref:Uncharacterized protein n=1 Tax=Bauhinia variegata TaxID=167791 RepID=A0ACB9NEU7_BAUVA|nr:hypothetical protein L6164_013603 [Bauhinia variegata]
MLPPEIVGEEMEPERFYDSVNVLFSLQGKNGGLAGWEPIRDILAPRRKSIKCGADNMGYDGFNSYWAVWHERRRPVHHSFQYQVRYALFDLDRATHAPPDHYSADEARQITDPTGPVLLLTIPPSVGYEQNPLSVYYCYDVEGSTRHLKKCIAEVPYASGQDTICLN